MHYSAVTFKTALPHLQGSHHLSHYVMLRLQLETLQSEASQ